MTPAAVAPDSTIRLASLLLHVTFGHEPLFDFLRGTVRFNHHLRRRAVGPVKPSAIPRCQGRSATGEDSGGLGTAEGGGFEGDGGGDGAAAGEGAAGAAGSDDGGGSAGTSSGPKANRPGKKTKKPGASGGTKSSRGGKAKPRAGGGFKADDIDISDIKPPKG